MATAVIPARSLGTPARRLFEDLVYDPDLQLLLPCNEASGSLVDRCVRNQLTATVTGAPVYDADLGRGFRGVTLNGTTDSFSLGSVFSYEYTQAFSLLAVVKPAVGSIQTVYAKEDSGITRGIFWYIDASGNLVFNEMNSNTNLITVSGPAAMASATQYVISVSYTGSGLASGVTQYKNGAALAPTVVSDTLGAATIINSAPARIGARGTSPNLWYSGSIAMVALFNAAKSAADHRRWAAMAGVI